jgi:alpha-beta hydrolase superfamily lysophospholipase
VSGFGAELPVFVAGMSLGGCIALHALLSSVRSSANVLALPGSHLVH